MNTSIALQGAQFLAAATPPRSRSPFNRAQFITRGAEGALVRVQTYTDTDHLDGTALSDEDLQGLLDAGQALALPAPVPASEGALLWVLRPNFPGRDRALQELKLRGVLAYAPVIGPDDSRLCIVNAGRTEAATLLDTWCQEAMERAKTHATRANWDSATTDAELAQALGRSLDAEVLALLGLVYEQTERATRAAGIMTMARRSRGESFGTQVDAALERLRATLLADAPAPPRTRLALRAALRERFPLAARSIGQRRDCRLVAA